MTTKKARAERISRVIHDAMERKAKTAVIYSSDLCQEMLAELEENGFELLLRQDTHGGRIAFIKLEKHTR
jgi:hypothetical protein